MSEVLGQLPALAGVALGIVGTLATTTIADAARWRREQSVRFDSRLLDACAEFSAAVRDLTFIVAVISADRRPWSTVPHTRSDSSPEDLRAATQRVELAWEALCLLADDATVSAARNLSNEAKKRREYVESTSGEIDQEVWRSMRADLLDARDEFVTACRESMSVKPLAETAALEPFVADRATSVQA
ncbi:hypothetical protein [Nocardioides sp. NPDC006303]|uniref:hypothetical protein n=1 Tax=Nocardioides sp. NPDC006303 TaxID=3156747 RepID=UPI0033B86E71